ncbi:OmpH family outer membrane protein [Algoriphagus namhaensis]|uniref:OmpH family outer membrane protein n=1 Tax=Algoriphagus namhaensis TaxID=915353 RepID=A0ABV8ATN4_9BACT
MKKTLNTLGILALSAGLFFACNQTAPTTTEGGESEVMSVSEMKLAFVKTDSVINKYEYFKTKSEEITEKGKRFEGELQSRARGFEQEVANFQQSAASMTMNQARAKEEELVKKEQNLMTYRNNLMQELSADEAGLYNDVYEKIQTYMKGFAEENGYTMVLSYTRGGAVWYANDAIDVTDQVIEGLNKAYNTTPTDSVK